MPEQKADQAIWNGRCGPMESALYAIRFIRYVWWGECWNENQL